MKFQYSVNELSDAWNRCTCAAAAKVGGCSTNETSGIRLPPATKTSSQTMVPSTSTANTGIAPVKQLASPPSPGWNGSVVSCQIWKPTAASPRTSATPAAASQGDLRPALIWVRPSDCTIALSTTRPMMTAPCHGFGPTKCGGTKLPCEFTD